MNTDQLKSFLAVAQTGSFSEAAAQLYITQSSVSKHIQSLERELGTALFDRSRRKISLTPAGEQALAEAQRMNTAYLRLLEAVRNAADEKETALRVASIPVMAQYDITGLLADFSARRPEICLEILEMEGIDMVNRLERREIDLAFLRISETEGNLDTLPLFEDRLSVVLSENHPLASREEISLRELSDEKFLFMSRGTLLYDLCVRVCREHGFAPRVIYTGTRIENILSLVRNNHGISLMMRQAVTYMHHEGTRVVPLKEETVSVIGLAKLHGERLNAAGRALWAYAAGSGGAHRP